MPETKKRIVIIGGGPGGYVAAIRAAQLGGEVTLIEKDALGGTCLNRGCVPTKFMVQAAAILAQTKTAKSFGINTGNVSVDFPQMMKQKQAVIRQLLSGVEYLMGKNHIRVLRGTGTLTGPGKIKVSGEKDALVGADRIIIATGSEPSSLPIEGADHSNVISSNEALNMEQFPASMIIIGGGVIGIEFAQIFQRFNTNVTVIEMMPHILPNEDAEISQILKDILRRDGIDIYTGAKVRSIQNNSQGKQIITFDTHDKSQVLACDCTFMAVGRKPYIRNCGIADVGIASGKNGKISVDKYLETTVSGIYAIGDVLGGTMLAHVAMAEGICAAENALGMRKEMDYQVIPRCVYVSPEVAGVGLTEEEAKSKYGKIKVGKFPFSASSKAVITGESDGLTKIIAEAKYNQVVGAEIIGPHATELIAEAALAIKMEATVEELISTIHAHPTLSETLAESALNALNIGIHF